MEQTDIRSGRQVEEAQDPHAGVSSSTSSGSHDRAEMNGSQPTSRINEVVSRSESTRDSNVRNQSPLHQIMARTAGRIAQSPSLDLAGSLAVVESEDESEPNSQGSAPSIDAFGTVSTARGRTNSFATTNRPRRNTMYSIDDDAALTSGPLFYNHHGFLALQESVTPQGAHEERDGGGQNEDAANTARQPFLPRSDPSQEPAEVAIHNDGPVVTLPRNSDRSSQGRRNLDRVMREYSVARRVRPTASTGTEESGTPRIRSRVDTEVDTIFRDLDRLDALVNRIARATVNDQSDRSDPPMAGGRQPQDSTSAPFLPTATALQAARLSWQRTLDNSSPASLISTSSESSRRREGRQPDHIDHTRGLPPRIDQGPSFSSTILGPRSTSRAANPLPEENERIRHLGMEAARLSSQLEKATLKTSKNAMRYLSKLKYDHEESIPSIQTGQSHNASDVTKMFEKDAVFDLPWALDELPMPAYSSWLEPGVRWTGQQFSRSPQTLDAEISRRRNLRNLGISDSDNLILNLRASRHRERVRAETLLRHRQRQLSDRIARTDPESIDAAELGSQSSSAGLRDMPFSHGMEVLADMERHLSDLLAERQSTMIDSPEWRLSRNLLNRPVRSVRLEPKDRWPVNVTIHAVDWEKMTLTGTMSASHIPDQNKPNLESSRSTDSGPEQETDKVSSIDSFFNGEIIDFRKNEIETVVDKNGYKSGGLGVDVKYWAGVGPFRAEVETRKHLERRRKQLSKEGIDHDINLRSTADPDHTKSETDSPGSSLEGHKSSPTNTVELDQTEIERIVDETMTMCLRSRKWLDEKLGQEWLLMRWKERCFVSPSNASRSTSGSSPNLRRSTGPLFDTSSSSSSTTYTPYDNASWGLTISGFYYIALHRQSGRIEGLYYDPGSQPYQRLVMVPTGNDAQGQTLDVGDAQLDDEASTSVELLGIRKWFPSNEFR